MSLIDIASGLIVSRGFVIPVAQWGISPVVRGTSRNIVVGSRSVVSGVQVAVAVLCSVSRAIDVVSSAHNFRVAIIAVPVIVGAPKNYWTTPVIPAPVVPSGVSPTPVVPTAIAPIIPAPWVVKSPVIPTPSIPRVVEYPAAGAPRTHP